MCLQNRSRPTPHKPTPAILHGTRAFAWLRLTERVGKSDMVAHRTGHQTEYGGTSNGSAKSDRVAHRTGHHSRLADIFGSDRSQAPRPIPVEPHPSRFPYLLWRFLPRLQAHGRNRANRDGLARSSSPLTCGDAKRHIPLRPICARFPFLLSHILPWIPDAGGKGPKG